MEFNVRLDAPRIDIAAFERLLQVEDPAGFADLDPLSGVLRISAALSDGDVAALLDRAGHAVDPSRIERLPSVCCGGCGG